MAYQSAPPIKLYKFMLQNIKRRKLIIVLVLVIGVLFLATSSSQAAINWGSTSSGASQLAGAAGLSQATSFDAILATLARPIIGMVGIIFFLIFLYGGFKWMTAGGNDTQVNEAKKLITSTVIGLAIVTLAYVIADFIIRALE